MTNNTNIDRIKHTRDRLNKVGPGMCAMKWLHQTLYLHTGDNHSCYHPRPHRIPLHEIKEDPSALHNTSFKKEQRKTMLEGGRPDECQYCWNVEDLEGDHISDRMIHSHSSFAVDEIEKLAELPWDAPINPRYLEVSFGNGCNYRCGYCSPQASTLWMDEIKKHGNYDLTYNQYGIEFLDQGSYFGPKDDNPYVEAFWKWWPTLRNDLWTLRITGGEPLMNPGAMQFFDLLEKEPAPQLEISINSNLGVTTKKINKMADRVQSLLDHKKIKSFSLFTSIEGWGAQAEYMRTGLQCDHWESNFVEMLNRGSKINIMCTFNILCVATFTNFLNKVIEWRKQYGYHAIAFDSPHLKEPPHWMINILPRDFLMKHMDANLKFIQDNKEWFTDVEYEKMKRVRDYADQNPVSEEKIREGRRDFYSFFTENDKRVVGLNLLEVFPMYEDFYNDCKEVYENYGK
jgi:organic radical activating enzyme|tara:strand:+ start:1562 stop:2932 length:1371 start_codon:yes stop_codon:yes gene_type:complete